MARNLEPKCHQCRRAGRKLFLKGERCFSAKCAIVKRNYPPGQHGPKKMVKLTPYGTQLRAKQRAKAIYGLLENQFALYVDKASDQTGTTGENLIKLLEKRLDNVVYRAGFATSRDMARQLVSHRHFLINDAPVMTPSIQVKNGDVIMVKNFAANKKIFETAKKAQQGETPEWISSDEKEGRIKVVAEPDPKVIGDIVDTQLILEYYSR